MRGADPSAILTELERRDTYLLSARAKSSERHKVVSSATSIRSICVKR